MTNSSPIYGYLKQLSLIDYPGQLAAVFFTSGCNFTCRFCHNKELIHKSTNCLTWDSLATLCTKFKESWASGAVITGGEPTIHHDLPQLVDRLKEFGFKVKLDTNGSNPTMLAKLLTKVDYVAMDIKTSLTSYPELTGFTNTSLLLESIQILKESNVTHEFRTTVIEPIHTEEKIQEMIPLLSGAEKYVLQPFVPRDTLIDPAFASYPRTSDSKLAETKQFFSGHVREVLP